MKKSTKIILLILVAVVIIGFAWYLIFYKENQKNKINNQLTNNSLQINTINNGTSTDTINTANNISVTYDEKIVKKITVGKASYICKEQQPIIKGINEEIANKIQKNLLANYAEFWNEVSEQTTDLDINEILTRIDNSENESRDIGFEQKYTIEYYNDKIITFKYALSGNLDGVPWDSTNGVSFYLNTGEKVNIKDLVTDESQYVKACKKFIYNELKNDKRYSNLQEGYNDVINTYVRNMNGYIEKDGIVCAHIPKYEMASGVDGEFIFTVSYDYIQSYMDFSQIK